jgi:hypothetical protein
VDGAPGPQGPTGPQGPPGPPGPGGGDVSFTGANSPVIGEIVLFNSTDGKQIQDSKIGPTTAKLNTDLDATGHIINTSTLNTISVNSSAVNNLNGSGQMFTLHFNASFEMTAAEMGLGSQPSAIRAISGGDILPSGVWTAIGYPNVISMQGVTYAAPTFTIPTALGLNFYYLSASMRFAANIIGWRGARVYNVTQNRYYAEVSIPNVGLLDDTLVNCSVIVPLNSNDVIQFEFYQNTGAPLTIGLSPTGVINQSYANVVKLY